MEPVKIKESLLNSSSWNSEESKNVQVIGEFVQLLMNDHNIEKVTELHSNADYTQHNRNIPEGITGITNYMKNFVKQFPEFSYDVKKVIADGDYVIFHSHATTKKDHRGNDKKGLNIVDTWRLKDGKIVEHWDSIQALDFSMRLYSLFAGGKIRNSNGVF